MPHNFRLCSIFQTTPCPSSARVAVNSTITNINILNIFASSFVWLCCVQPGWWREEPEMGQPCGPRGAARGNRRGAVLKGGQGGDHEVRGW